jgi:hypothetical protein
MIHTPIMTSIGMAKFIESSEITSPFDKTITSMFQSIRCAKPDDSIPILLYKPDFAVPSSWNKYDVLYKSDLHSIKVYVDNDELFDSASVYFTKMFGERQDETDESIIWKTDTLYTKYKTISNDTNALQFDIIAMEKECETHPTESLKNRLDMARHTWLQTLIPLKRSYRFDE